MIILGTNDVSTKGDLGLPVQTAYVDFVRGLRQRYPGAFFVLAIGPMLEGGQFTAIKKHLQAVISTRAAVGDSQMSYLQFPVQRASDGYGCDYHSSAATNAKMAPLPVAELKALQGR